MEISNTQVSKISTINFHHLDFTSVHFSALFFTCSSLMLTHFCRIATVLTNQPDSENTVFIESLKSISLIHN